MNKACLLIIAFLSFFSSSRLIAQGDNCSTALQITNVINYCSGSGAYTNVGSTTSGLALPTCWTAGTPTEDVWFQFTAIGTDVLMSIGGTGAGGTLIRPRIAIYNGTCAGSLTLLGCAQANSGSGIVQLFEDGLQPGTVYFIRVSTTNAQEGTFELCINNYTPYANPTPDCNGAAYLCSKNPVSVSVLSGGGANNDEIEDATCLGTAAADEGNSSWFYWTCSVSGTLIFDITPINPNDDIDFILYELASNTACGPRSPIRCNAASCLNANGSTGLSLSDQSISEPPGCDFVNNSNAYCQYVDMVAGRSYALLVNNWSGNTGYTTNFGGTGEFLGPDLSISTSAVTICAGETISFDASASTNVSGGLSWNFLNGGAPVSASGAGPHTINYTSPGSYVAILNGTDALGCPAIEVANVTVGAISPAPLVTNQVYCQNAIANQLSATGTNLLWYLNSSGGVGSAVAPTPSTTNVGNTIYYVTQTSSGCESPRVAVNVYVIANPQITVVTPVNLTCVPSTINLTGSSSSSNPSYLWTGPGVVSGSNTTTPTVNGAGVYTLQVTSGLCSSTETVVVNPPLGAPQLTSSVNNDTLTCAITSVQGSASSSTTNVSFQWTGPSAGNIVSNTAAANLTTPGTYTITATDQTNGCINVNSFQISSNTTSPIISPSTSNEITCNTLTSTLSTTLNSSLTYNWTGPAVGTPAGTSPTSNSTVVNLAGTYTLIATDINNACSSSSSILVSSNTTPPSVTIGTNQSITCVVNTVSISGSGSSNIGAGVAYHWTGPTVGAPAGTTPNASQTNVSSAGTYTLTITDQNNGCTIAGTLNVIASTDLPSISATAIDSISCNTNSVALVATSSTSAVHYLWLGPTLSDTLGISDTVVATAAGTYTLTVVDTTNNCVSSVQTQLITDLTNPIITVGTNPLLSCAVTVVPINASSNVLNANYSWVGPAAGVAAGDTPNNDTTHVSAAGIYTVTVTSPQNGCVSSATVLVNSNGSQTIVNAGPASATLPCGSSGITLSGTQLQSGYQYVWTNTAGTILNPSGGSVATGVNTAGTYYLTATNPATGCSSTDSIKVIPGVVPNASFSPSINSGYLPLPVVYTNTSTGASNYQWYVSGTNGLPVAYTSAYANTFTTPGMYTVTLVAGNGNVSCNASTSVVIEVKEYATVVMPNIFSPNADDVNDFLKPITTGMKSLSIEIFNRWGTKVISFDGLGTGWDGLEHSAGTYFYVAKGVGDDGTLIEEKGFVLMVK